MDNKRLLFGMSILFLLVCGTAFAASSGGGGGGGMPPPFPTSPPPTIGGDGASGTGGGGDGPGTEGGGDGPGSTEGKTPPGDKNKTKSIESGLCELYNMVNQLLAVVVFVLIVTAAIVYAAGQVMGAETRARASVWATSMIIGALIGIMIYLLVPTILGTMLGGSTTICGHDISGTTTT